MLPSYPEARTAPSYAPTHLASLSPSARATLREFMQAPLEEQKALLDALHPQESGGEMDAPPGSYLSWMALSFRDRGFKAALLVGGGAAAVYTLLGHPFPAFLLVALLAATHLLVPTVAYLGFRFEGLFRESLPTEDEREERRRASSYVLLLDETFPSLLRILQHLRRPDLPPLRRLQLQEEWRRGVQEALLFL